MDLKNIHFLNISDLILHKHASDPIACYSSSRLVKVRTLIVNSQPPRVNWIMKGDTLFPHVQFDQLEGLKFPVINLCVAFLPCIVNWIFLCSLQGVTLFSWSVNSIITSSEREEISFDYVEADSRQDVHVHVLL